MCQHSQASRHENSTSHEVLTWGACHMQRVRDALVSERQALLEGLQSIPFLEPYPSQANFILCKVSNFISRGLSGIGIWYHLLWQDSRLQAEASLVCEKHA